MIQKEKALQMQGFFYYVVFGGLRNSGQGHHQTSECLT